MLNTSDMNEVPAYTNANVAPIAIVTTIIARRTFVSRYQRTFAFRTCEKKPQQKVVGRNMRIQGQNKRVIGLFNSIST
jgi:hypothetical protein